MNEFVTVSQIIFAFKALMPLFTFTFLSVFGYVFANL